MKLTLFAAGLLSTVAAPALAQASLEPASAAVTQSAPGTGDPDNDIGIEEIVVTAQRRAQLLSEVPIAITAITGESFENQGFDTVEDLVGTVPSLTFGSSATARGEGLVIRGFGTTSFSDAAEGAVGIVIDGVTLGRQASGLIDLIDVERIEVLRGPQGTLFGKNASAGLINIVTRRPSNEFEADARASYGTQDELRLAASISGPLAGDAAGFRLTGFRSTRDGMLRQFNPAFNKKRVNDEDQWGVRGKLEFKPNDRLNMLLIGEYQKQDVLCCNWTRRTLSPAAAGALSVLERTALAGFYTPGPSNRDVALTIRSNFQKSETYAGTLDASFDLGAATFRSITGYRRFDISEGNKTDQLPVSFFDLAATDSEIEQLSQELQLISSGDGPFEYTLGLFFFRLDVDSVQRQEASFSTIPGVGNVPGPLVPILLGPGAAAAFPPSTRVNIQNQAQRTTNYAAYGQISYEFTPKFTAVLGARLLRESLDVRFDRSGGLPLGAFGQRIPLVDPDAITDTALTWTGSLRYEFTDGVSAYATYSRGYKGRAYDLNAGSPVALVNGVYIFEALDPEQVDNYELGVRSRLFGRRLQVNLTAFNTDVKDYQAAAQRTDGVPGFVLNNVGRFRTRGVEVELVARPIRGFEVGGNLSILDAEYRSYPRGECPNPFVANRPASCVASGFQDLSGRQAANAPDFSGAVYAQATLPLGGGFDIVGWGQVTFRTDTLYSLTQDPNTIQEGYELVNGRLTLRSDKGFEVALWGRNLFDVDYAESIFSTPVFSGGYSQFIARGRQVDVEARVRF